MLKHIVIVQRNSEPDMKWTMINYISYFTLLHCTYSTYISISSGKDGAIWLQTLIHLMFSQLAKVI